jgi:hypothetical protein
VFLLDRPHASAALLDSLERHRFPVVATGAARALAGGRALAWIDEDEAAARLAARPALRVHTNSESALDWLAARAPGSAAARGARACKDKPRFREATRGLHPGLWFRRLRADELATVDVADWRFPCFVKPAAGFFSLGVHRVARAADWPAVRARLGAELERFAGLFPDSVLDRGGLIVEEEIPGREFAVDASVDGGGRVAVLGLLEHVFQGPDDVSDRVYRCTAELVEAWRGPFAAALEGLAAALGLRDFSLHAELRVRPDGAILPIELNPLRFGGFCTTAELSAHAWGFDPYAAHLLGAPPDWERILPERAGRSFHLVVLDDTTGLPLEEAAAFDLGAVARSLPGVLAAEPVDRRVAPLFGFLVVETAAGEHAAVDRLQASDLREFVVPA